MSRHGDRHVEAPGADGDHPERAARGGVGVGAHEDGPRPRIALDVHVVADAVAGSRVVDPVLATQRPQHPVVVGVLEVELDHVVVDVLQRALDLDPRDVELLELHERHGPGGVLEQRLVDLQRDRLAWRELTVDDVVAEDLAGEVLGHSDLCSLRAS